jgi:hypothetical protein
VRVSRLCTALTLAAATPLVAQPRASALAVGATGGVAHDGARRSHSDTATPPREEARPTAQRILAGSMTGIAVGIGGALLWRRALPCHAERCESDFLTKGFVIGAGVGNALGAATVPAPPCTTAERFRRSALGAGIATLAVVSLLSVDAEAAVVTGAVAPTIGAVTALTTCE